MLNHICLSLSPTRSIAGDHKPLPFLNHVCDRCYCMLLRGPSTPSGAGGPLRWVILSTEYWRTWVSLRDFRLTWPALSSPISISIVNQAMIEAQIFCSTHAKALATGCCSGVYTMSHKTSRPPSKPAVLQEE